MFVWQRHDGFVIHLPLFINEYHFYSYCRPYLLQSIFTNWPIPASILFYFRPFHITIEKSEAYLDGLLGIQTRCHRMTGADRSTEVWRAAQSPEIFRHVTISIY